MASWRSRCRTARFFDNGTADNRPCNVLSENVFRAKCGMGFAVSITTNILDFIELEGHPLDAHPQLFKESLKITRNMFRFHVEMPICHVVYLMGIDKNSEHQKSRAYRKSALGTTKLAFSLLHLVAFWPAILRFAGAWAALILRLPPAGLRFGVFIKKALLRVI